MHNEGFLAIYIEECDEHLASVENDLVEMERQGPEVDEELVNRVFRAAHSIKGGAGFFELVTIKELAHRLENVLEMIRSHGLAPNPEVVNQLLGGFDRLKSLLKDVDTANGADISDEIVALEGLTASYLPSSRKAEAAEKKRFPIPGSSQVLEAGALEISAARGAGKGIALLRFDLIHDVQRLGKTPLEVLKHLESDGTVLDCVIDMAAVGNLDSETIFDALPFFVLYSTSHTVVEIARTNDIPTSGIAFLELPTMPEVSGPGPVATIAGIASPVVEDAAAAPVAPKEKNACAEGIPEHHEAQDSTIRVQVAVLDKLMNIAGELVLARNELLEALNSRDQPTMINSGRRIDVVTREVQEAAMLTRMQPVGNLFSRYPRIVRDCARDLGKNIELSIFGREVEVDKTILETLSDPLNHLVRNACDHGIEAPDVRVAADKPPTGTIWLKAQHEAGNVVVEIRDDGGGIDVEAVTAKALSMGLVTSERLKFMSEKEKAALIFLPGLSTAKKVTDLSGRGVGMDVVKTNIDKLGGQIEIATERRKGTAFRIKLPLTLAIIPSLLVLVSGERYAIPETNVEELLQIRPGDPKNRIERMGDRTVLVLRGSYLPLVRLADALAIPREDHDASCSSVVVVNSAALKYALVVDDLYDTMEIVVKPLGSHFAKLQEYSGATILGNGATALILDTTGVANRAGLASGEGREGFVDLAGEKEVELPERESRGLLLFGNGLHERCAMPLESVERVMRIARESIDTVGKTRVFAHEGKSLPVFTLRDAFDASDIMSGEGDLALIVGRVAGKKLGIIVTPPVDSLSTEVEIDRAAFSARGLAGSTVIRGKTTLIVDLEEFARIVKPEWFAAAGAEDTPRQAAAMNEAEAAGAGPLVLIADDSDFFLAKVRQTLLESGYRVVEARNGEEALSLYDADAQRIDAIVSDIEMPGIDGFELVKRIRARGSSVPVVALTSLASDEDRRKGVEAGVDAFLVKLDGDELIRELGKLIADKGHQTMDGRREI